MPAAPHVLKHLVTATLVTLVVVAAGTVATSEQSGGDRRTEVARAQVDGSADPAAAPEPDPGAVAAAAETELTAAELPAYQILAPHPPLARKPDASAEPTPTPVPTPVVDPDSAPEYLPGMVLRQAPPPAPESFSFRVGTFNVLGSQHTRGSGRWAPGPTRAGFTAELVSSRGLDLVGLQEMQRDQLGVIQGRLGAHTVWPGTSLGNNGVRLQIAFRTDLFEVVSTETITTVFHRQQRPIPILRLRHKPTGGEFYVMNVHNSPLGMQGERDSAKAAQIAKVNQLRGTGLPVIMMGDMNEKEGFFCRVGSATGMVAANGGSTAGGCQMPPGPVKIDWIMGGGVEFSGYTREEGGLVARASDHNFIHSMVEVDAVTSEQPDAEQD